MRILFRHRGHADQYLKACKKHLLGALSASNNAHLPLQPFRNWFALGAGYNSFNELLKVLGRRSGSAPAPISPLDLLQSLQLGFRLALAEVPKYGFRFDIPAESLAKRLADETAAFLTLRHWLSPATGQVKEYSMNQDTAQHKIVCTRCGYRAADFAMQIPWLRVPAKLFPFRRPQQGELGYICHSCVQNLRFKSKSRGWPGRLHIAPELCLIEPPHLSPAELKEIEEDGATYDYLDGTPEKLAEDFVKIPGIKFTWVRMPVQAAQKHFPGDTLRHLFAGRDEKYYWFQSDDNHLPYYACPDIDRNSDRRSLRNLLKSIDDTEKVREELEAEALEYLVRISRSDDEIRQMHELEWNAWHQEHVGRSDLDGITLGGLLPAPKTAAELAALIKRNPKTSMVVLDSRPFNDAVEDCKEYLASGEFETDFRIYSARESGGGFMHGPYRWLLKEAIAANQSNLVEVFRALGKGFATFVAGVPEAAELICDASEFFGSLSPYPPNTVVFIAFTLDGRAKTAQIPYRRTKAGRLRPAGEVIIEESAAPILLESATSMLEGWLDATLSRPTGKKHWEAMAL